jgi:ligand-binding sensor domain-containing protein
MLIVAGAWLLISRLAPSPAPEGWTVIRPPHEVTCLMVVGDQIWGGGRDGLFACQRSDGEPLALPEPATELSYVSTLLRDRHGTIWIGCAQGLVCHDQGAWQIRSEHQGEPLGPVLSLLETRDGRLLIGRKGGYLVLSRDRQALGAGPEIGISSVDTMYQDQDGVLWLGCASPTHGCLLSFDGTAWRTYSAGREVPHPAVNMITRDRHGTLWVATGFANRGGAARLSNGVWSWLTRSDGLAGEKVRSIAEDRLGRLWFGSEYDGVAILDQDRWTVIPPRTGLAGREVKVVVQDADGVYWFGTDGGLTRIEPDAITDLLKSSDRRAGIGGPGQ